MAYHVDHCFYSVSFKCELTNFGLKLLGVWRLINSGKNHTVYKYLFHRLYAYELYYKL